MSLGPSDKEIAEALIDEMPSEAELLTKWFAQRFPKDAAAVNLAESDKSFAIGILVALFQRTKDDRPPISEANALEFINALNGIELSPLPYSILPSILAAEISSGIIEAPESEPLRRELEECAGDPDFMELMSQTKPAIQYDWTTSLTPEVALALVVGIQFWWAHRTLLSTEIEYAKEPETFRLGHFFNLVEQPKAD